MRFGLLGLLLLTAAGPPAAQLADFNWMIGEWNGVAQPKRGSAVGSWTESIDVAYTFDAAKTEPSGIELTHDGSQVFETITLEAAAKNVRINRPDGTTVVLPLSESTESRWIYGDQQEPFRLTLRKLSEIRIVLLLEARRGTRFRREVEIGYTRAGEKLASGAGSGPQCIVTGGRGTIAVEHNGQTYYVCCSGCRQAFEKHPDAIIEAAKARATE